jgi:O-antigen chain-terminating methyltransferase
MSAAKGGDIHKADDPKGTTPLADDQPSPLFEINDTSIDEIMTRVRQIVANRRDGLAKSGIPRFGSVRSADLFVPKWKSEKTRLSVKDRYAVSELIAFSDADFVEVAYQAILRRPADENGFNHYLHLLRSGAATKVDVLWTICCSEEAKVTGVRVDGLEKPYRFRQWRRKRIVGPILGWAHSLIKLGTLSDRLGLLDAKYARTTREIGDALNDASSHLRDRLIGLRGELGSKVSKGEFDEIERASRQNFSFNDERLSNLENKIAALEESFTRERRSRDQHTRRDTSTPLTNRTDTDQSAQDSHTLDDFYADFEDQFRGDPSVVRARMEPYLSVVREAAAGSTDAPVLDVGCGRGEWLELLRDSGLIARGIDVNHVFLHRCREKGLDVIEGDAIAVLQTMQPGSIGMITSMHVVEHLRFDRLIALMDESFRVLRPGGFLLIETPNPENLLVAHHLFFMDPTHRNPIPPQALRWIVEARGFREARIERLVAARDWHQLALLPEDNPSASSVNAIISSLNVAADYAVIAKRL